MEKLSKDFINQLRFNQDGLIPAIAQDWLDGAVLMMAWMNKQSLELTINTGEVHYWSRSRQEIWHKGKTSGFTQFIKDIRHDCDADVVLLTIEQKGSISCHKGTRSCFFPKSAKNLQKEDIDSNPPADTASEIYKVIEKRISNPEKGSYTNKLVLSGDNLILKKIGEESAEFIMACKDNEINSIKNEAADLLFHIQVALAHHKVEWREVLEILENRKGAQRRK